MLIKTGITILDKSMKINEIRILKSHSEILGFNIQNDTGSHLFIEPIFDSLGHLNKLIINKEL